jgi:dihydrofolate reductase
VTATRGAAVEFDVVVAADLGEGIGRAGAIPWRLPTDVAHLKKLTTETTVPGCKNAVVMGRVTWDTIPDKWRPLPGRHNLVITRQINLTFPAGVIQAHGLPQALEQAGALVDCERIFVLGGGEVYREAVELPGCRRIYLTRVLAQFDCDTFFPPLPSRFRREGLLAEGRDGELGYRIELWTHAAA